MVRSSPDCLFKDWAGIFVLTRSIAIFRTLSGYEGSELLAAPVSSYCTWGTVSYHTGIAPHSGSQF